MIIYMNYIKGKLTHLFLKNEFLRIFSFAIGITLFPANILNNLVIYLLYCYYAYSMTPIFILALWGIPIVITLYSLKISLILCYQTRLQFKKKKNLSNFMCFCFCVKLGYNWKKYLQE